MPTTGHIQTPAGVGLVYDSVGEGPPVLLLHGGGQTRHAWAKTAQALADLGYRAISVDARGHGESDWADRYGLPLYVEDLRAVIASLAPDAAPAIIGASMGGMTAIAALGGNNPPPTSALVLVDIAPRLRIQGAEPIQAFMTANQDGFASVEEAADAVAHYMTDRPRPANTSGLRKNLRERDGRLYWHWDPKFMTPDANVDMDQARLNLEEAATRVTVPTLLVRGEHSQIVDEEAVAHFREAVPHGEVAEVAGAGHMVAGDANTPFTARIIDFLARVYPA